MAQTGPKIKIAQNLLKFGTSNISSMSISLSMSKIIFMKNLPPVRTKLVPKLKMLKIYWNLTHLIFRISNLDFDVKNDFSLNILPILRPKLVPIWMLVTRKSHYFYFLELVTRKFYFNLLFSVSNSKVLICLFNSS